MIVLLCKLIFITSLLVIGYTIFTSEGMGGYSIRLWATKKKEAGLKWAEPILLCHYCQPSTWSLLGFIIAYGLGIINSFSWNYFLLYILCVAGSSIVNGLVWGLHQSIIARKGYYEGAQILTEAQLENIYTDIEDEESEEHFFDYENFNN